MATDPRFEQIRSLIDQFKDLIGMSDCEDEAARLHAWRTFKRLTDSDTLGWYQEAKYHPAWPASNVVRSLAMKARDWILHSDAGWLSADQVRAASRLIVEVAESLVPAINAPA